MCIRDRFGDTGTHIIGTRHGEKLYETLMTREERLRSEDMGNYYRVAADNRDLNYDKYVVKGQVHTMADESYTCLLYTSTITASGLAWITSWITASTALVSK